MLYLSKILWDTIVSDSSRYEFVWTPFTLAPRSALYYQGDDLRTLLWMKNLEL